MQQISVKNLFREEVGATISFEVHEDGKQFGFPEAIIVGAIDGNGKVIRLEDTVAVNGLFTAEASLICDRCLDNFETNLSFSFEREYTLDRKSKSEEDLYVDKYGNVDLSVPIYDELLLSIPTQNYCKKACLGICQGCGHNLNHDDCTCKI